MNAYAEFVDFVVNGMTPEQIIAYKPPKKLNNALMNSYGR